MEVLSLKKHPHYAESAIQFFQNHWASEKSINVYTDCIMNSPKSKSCLPEWYLLIHEGSIVGGAGLVTNDFISRMDLYPWLCALYIEEEYRGKNYAKLLIDEVKKDTKNKGFESLYLSTDHINYYEKMGFEYLAVGYHPWGETSMIYRYQL